MKFRHKKNIKFNLLFYLVLIVINSYFILFYLGMIISHNIEVYLSKVLEINMYKYVFDTFDKELLSDDTMNDFIILETNNNGEIVSIDYNLNKVYGYLSDNLNSLYSKVRNEHIEDQYYDDKKNFFLFPLGFISNNYLFSGIGPIIPVEMNCLNDVHTGIKTRVTNYGINYLLVEVYVHIEVISHFVAPMLDKDYNSSYDILIASKIINGSIPSYYGGVIEKSSSIVSS